MTPVIAVSTPPQAEGREIEVISDVNYVLVIMFSSFKIIWNVMCVSINLFLFILFVY